MLPTKARPAGPGSLKEILHSLNKRGDITHTPKEGQRPWPATRYSRRSLDAIRRHPRAEHAGALYLDTRRATRSARDRTTSEFQRRINLSSTLLTSQLSLVEGSRGAHRVQSS